MDMHRMYSVPYNGRPVMSLFSRDIGVASRSKRILLKVGCGIPNDAGNATGSAVMRIDNQHRR